MVYQKPGLLQKANKNTFLNACHRHLLRGNKWCVMDFGLNTHDQTLQ